MGTILKKLNFRRMIFATLLYIVAVAIVIISINVSILNNDTNRTLDRVDNVKTLVTSNPSTDLPSNVSLIGKNTHNSDTAKIADGAAYSRVLHGENLTITSPIFDNGQITKYVVLTETRTSTTVINSLLAIAALGFYFAVAIYTLRREHRNFIFSENTVAKIKNIERSPLTQSYLISDGDDKITMALNHLGERIQSEILSQDEKKENLYEFIEFFQFPMFIYNEKGSIRRTNAFFKNEFSDTKNLDVFSPYADFMTFLVDKMLNPTIQEKVFYFDNINAYYQVRITPIIDMESRFLVSMMDVTRYRRTLDAHNDFIANVSHELKTPLASIKGFAELLQHSGLELEEQQKFAQIIEQESQRLIDLVQDTLSLTKQNVKIERKNISLSNLTQHILESLEPQISEKQLQVSANITSVDLRTNENMIHRIFKNLIENALKYTPNRGKIFISLHKSDGKVTFSVADNGPGLTDLQKSRIFDRFYRVDESRSKVAGTGLGLAIVEKNVRELGGKIDLVSVPNKGTTFTVIL